MPTCTITWNPSETGITEIKSYTIFRNVDGGAYAQLIVCPVLRDFLGGIIGVQGCTLATPPEHPKDPWTNVIEDSPITYVDTTVTEGHTYCYYVTAQPLGNNQSTAQGSDSAPSNIQCIVAVNPIPTLLITHDYLSGLNLESLMSPSQLTAWQNCGLTTINVASDRLGTWKLSGDNAPNIVPNSIVAPQIRNTAGNYNLVASQPTPRDLMTVRLTTDGSTSDGVSNAVFTIFGHDGHGHAISHSFAGVIGPTTFITPQIFNDVTQVSVNVNITLFPNVTVSVGYSTPNNDGLTIPIHCDVTINLDSSMLRIYGSGGVGGFTGESLAAAGQNGGNAIYLYSADGLPHLVTLNIANQTGATIGRLMGAGGGGGSGAILGGGGGGAGGYLAGLGGGGVSPGSAGQTYEVNGIGATGGAGGGFDGSAGGPLATVGVGALAGTAGRVVRTDATLAPGITTTVTSGDGPNFIVGAH